MTIITNPVNANEVDLLLGNANKTLFITDLDGTVLIEILPPLSGFTHEILEDIDKDLDLPDGYNVYLDKEWVGSSEI